MPFKPATWFTCFFFFILFCFCFFSRCYCCFKSFRFDSFFVCWKFSLEMYNKSYGNLTHCKSPIIFDALWFLFSFVSIFVIADDDDNDNNGSHRNCGYHWNSRRLNVHCPRSHSAVILRAIICNDLDSFFFVLHLNLWYHRRCWICFLFWKYT